MKKQDLIISLIKDNLISSKLLYGLNAMGLNSDHYSLHLSETIFELMGFKNNEETDKIFEHYLTLTHKINGVDFSQSHVLLDKLARDIYFELLELSPKAKK